MIALEKMEAYMKYEELPQMAERSRKEIAQLLAMGIDPNFEDAEGRTPLLIAAEHGDTAVIKLLLEKGADPNHKNKHDAESCRRIQPPRSSSSIA